MATVTGARAGTIAAMRTVPVGVADVLLGEFPDLRRELAAFGRWVGVRPEVDLVALGAVHPALCRALESYHSRTLALWTAVRDGNADAMGYLVTRRLVVDHQQVTSKSGRSDLSDVFDLLASLPVTDRVLHELTAPTIDSQKLQDAVHDVEGSVLEMTGAGASVSVPLTGAAPWPPELGGVCHLTEVDRIVTLNARHAAWRDRRVRRLARVQAHVQELWADPAPDLAALRP